MLSSKIKTLLSLAYPVALGQAGIMLMGLVDNMMVGQLGADPLAACAFANNIIFMTLVWGIGLTMGMMPLVSGAQAKGEWKHVTALLYNQLLISFFVSIFVIFIGVFLYQYLDFFGQPAHIPPLAGSYYLWVCASQLPVLMFSTLRNFTDSLSFTKIGMKVIFMTNIVNALLNYWFIYGGLGLSALGIEGAGMATFLSRIFMFAFMCYFIWKGSAFNRYKYFFRAVHVSWGVCKKLLKIGVPTGFQLVIEVAAFAIGALLIGQTGEKPMAAHQIAIGLAGISYLLASGLSTASTIKVSQLLAGQQVRLAFAYARLSLLLTLGFMALMALLFIALNGFLPLLFIKSDEWEVVKIASSLLIVAGFFQLSDGIQVIAMGILRGMEDVRLPTLIAVLAYMGIGLPLGYVFCFIYGYGAIGIWYGFLLGLTAGALLLAWRVFQRFRKRLLTAV